MPLRVRATSDDFDPAVTVTGDPDRNPGQLRLGDGGGLSIGVGDALDAEGARVLAAKVIERTSELGWESVAWDGPEPAAFVEGAILAAYRYDARPADDDEPSGPGVLLVRSGAEASTAAVAQNEARDLANAPGNVLTPTKLAARARELASEVGLECEVLGREQIRYAGMGAFAAVAQGTDEEPQLITLKYTPSEVAEGSPVLGLVGKAVTFDSGGISIKPALKMSTMKADMGGGAAVLAAIAAIARLELPVRVVAVIGATENLPGPRAVKPGDVVRARSGTTIEVVNTDAEGRLVLCDCLVHAREQGAERLIDVATLTGGIVVALGSVYAGLFASDDAWCETVRAAGERAGEPLWRMPLHERYADSIKGPWSDIVNAVEDRKAAPVTAAEFLHRFVGDVPWAHLDIAGVGWDGGRPYAPKGGSGFATRTLVEVARSLAG